LYEFIIRWYLFYFHENCHTHESLFAIYSSNIAPSGSTSILGQKQLEQEEWHHGQQGQNEQHWHHKLQEQQGQEELWDRGQC